MKNTGKIILFSLLLFAQLPAAVGQSNTLDSFIRIYNKKKMADSVRLAALDEIAWIYIYSNPDTALVIARSELKQSITAGHIRSQAQAYNTQGVSHWVLGRFDSALQAYNHGLALMEQIHDLHGIASATNNIGLIYKDKGDYKKAIVYYKKSLSIQEKRKNKKGIATSLNNLGVIYFELREFGSAKKYYQEALKIRRETNDKFEILSTLTNLGGVALATHDTARAIQYLAEGLILGREIDNQLSIATSLSNLAAIYYNKGDLATAGRYHTEAYEIRKQIGDRSGLAVSLLDLAMIDKQRGNLSAARSKAEEALMIDKDMQDFGNIQETSRFLYRVYKELNLTGPALEMHELYIAMRDSLNSDENRKAAIRQEYQYSYDKQQALKDAQRAAEKKQEKAIARAEEKKRNIILIAVSCGLLIVIGFSVFLLNRFRVIRRQKNTIALQKAEVEIKSELVEEKNKEILDSIQYAKRLQTAILPPEKYVKDTLGESFVLFRPKDIVSGDFYWVETSETMSYVGVVDCTGHGVPGAMVSVVGHNGLNRALKEFRKDNPAAILDQLSLLVEETFAKSEQEVRDGMDAALCAIDLTTGKLWYAGANNSLYHVRKGVLTEYKANKQPIGWYEHRVPFTNHELQLEKGDCVYLFSDGYADQFGGPRGKKFKYQSFKILLAEIHDLPMSLQREELDSRFNAWRGVHEQVDDVCIIGMRV